MAGVLTVFGSNPDKAMEYIDEAKRMGIKLLPPDINSSEKGFAVNDDSILFGFDGIKGLGEAAIASIIDFRPFDSITDLIERVPKRKLNKKALKVLTLSGAFDSLMDSNLNRMQMLESIYAIRGDKDDIREEVALFNNKRKYELEKELMGIYISGNPLDDVASPINWDFTPDNEKISGTGILTSFKVLKTKKGDDMAFLNIDTLEGNKRMLLFPQQYEKVADLLVNGVTLHFICYMKYSLQYDERSIIIHDIKVPKRINKHLLSPLGK